MLLKPVCAVDVGGGAFSIQTSTNMKLPACPDSPNCVSSMDWAKESFVEPLRFSDTAEEALLRVKFLIQYLPRITIIDEQNNSIYAEVRSRIFGFVDEVHLLVDSANKVIHIRSASRRGYWDFGVNRRRVERIREQFKSG